MENRPSKIAEALLKIKAVSINPAQPFKWSKGWVSPIYCDNRRTISYPYIRNLICEEMVNFIHTHFPDAGAIAGVSTGGIPHGMLVADRLNLPFVYLREKPKGHGGKNQVEGEIFAGLQYVVIEDLVSTGKSSMNAIRGLREAGGQDCGLISIFTYGFRESTALFESEQVRYMSLIDLNLLLQKALENDYIRPSDREVIASWREQPDTWSPSAASPPN